MAVWEGIRRTHGAPPEQAATLMSPELFDVLAACPQVKRWKTRGRASEPDLAGLRDTALLLVGFVAALRRSELADLVEVDEVAEHTNGAVPIAAVSNAFSLTNRRDVDIPQWCKLRRVPYLPHPLLGGDVLRRPGC